MFSTWLSPVMKHCSLDFDVEEADIINRRRARDGQARCNASIRLSLSPENMTGTADGKVTLKKICFGVAPNVREKMR
jgi:hypothetical protein